MLKKLLPYFGIFGGLIVTSALAHFGGRLFNFFHMSGDASLVISFFVISIIFSLNFFIFHLSVKTVIPSFVIAIFFGIAAHPFLKPVVEEGETLSTVVALGATLILFSGGLETPFENFKKLFWKITALSFPGLVLTSFLFSGGLFFLGHLLGIELSLLTCILLGAVLASTDPAAIIPVLKVLRFKNRSTKDVIVSESAMTDVTGTLLTLVFLTLMSSGIVFSSITHGYSSLFSKEAGMLLLRQGIFGVIFGFIGYVLLSKLTKFKQSHNEEYEADAAFFLFVPVIIFSFALSFGGSGYLAAFVAGLLFTLTKHLHRTEGFFNHMIEGFFKPTIFMLLGALVEIQGLLDYAVIGIVSALLFMFVIRPISVFVTLGPFSFFGDDRFSWKELLFISFVRETGAIPAVLLVTVVSSGITGLEGLVPIGMWVILLTLIIEPPLTPWFAKKLSVAEVMTDEKNIQLKSDVPFVVLVSRGYSFLDRLSVVVDWANKHKISRVVLLHCLEDNYSKDRVTKVEEISAAEFQKISQARQAAGLQDIEFSLVSRKGLLHKNIKSLAEEQEGVIAIFVGRKVLDFRLEEIKHLQVPLFFID